jgi:glycosyltransferase involved in cell wall biosynthesis
MARFDVYVCSSLAESSPVAVWEAMAMARPVVSTDVGDVPRHIADGENGYVVPVGDHAALAARALRLIEDPALARRLGANARAEVLACFTPARIAEKTLALYRRALAAPDRKTSDTQ